MPHFDPECGEDPALDVLLRDGPVHVREHQPVGLVQQVDEESDLHLEGGDFVDAVVDASTQVKVTQFGVSKIAPEKYVLYCKI